MPVHSSLLLFVLTFIPGNLTLICASACASLDSDRAYKRHGHRTNRQTQKTAIIVFQSVGKFHRYKVNRGHATEKKTKNKKLCNVGNGNVENSQSQSPNQFQNKIAEHTKYEKSKIVQRTLEMGGRTFMHTNWAVALLIKHYSWGFLCPCEKTADTRRCEIVHLHFTS